MKNRTPLMTALALALLFAPVALVAQEAEEAAQQMTGCLQMDAEGGGFVLVEESGAGQTAVEGAEDELKAATGNTVTVTGTAAADAEGNAVLQAESVEDSGEACAEGEEEHPTEGEEEHPEGEDEHPGA